MQIKDLINQVLEVKGLDDPEGELRAQLYIDITTSSKFVYMGENMWDLKDRQSLEEYDKDGSSFNTGEDDEDDENGLSMEDYNLDPTESDDDDDENDDEDNDEDDEDNESDDDEDIDDDLDEDSDLDEEFETETYDETDTEEDDYNDIMDQYESLYDKE
jgi:DNA-directed RNA polymerase subunit delta